MDVAVADIVDVGLEGIRQGRVTIRRQPELGVRSQTEEQRRADGVAASAQVGAAEAHARAHAVELVVVLLEVLVAGPDVQVVGRIPFDLAFQDQRVAPTGLPVGAGGIGCDVVLVRASGDVIGFGQAELQVVRDGARDRGVAVAFVERRAAETDVGMVLVRGAPRVDVDVATRGFASRDLLRPTKDLHPVGQEIRLAEIRRGGGVDAVDTDAHAGVGALAGILEASYSADRQVFPLQAGAGREVHEILAALDPYEVAAFVGEGGDRRRCLLDGLPAPRRRHDDRFAYGRTRGLRVLLGGRCSRTGVGFGDVRPGPRSRRGHACAGRCRRGGLGLGQGGAEQRGQAAAQHQAASLEHLPFPRTRVGASWVADFGADRFS